ncbi:uncharacterized protein LOC141851342 [Brevipalpus obovatus]|uniref:uncharacterized protein LOC141851342 n=1 Tax=Brevipalpus obovatus TaxID=246614 RepID=UPI003D9E0AA7
MFLLSIGIVYLMISFGTVYGLGKSSFHDCGPPDRVFRFGNVTFPDTMFISSVPNTVLYGKLDILEDGDPNDYMGTTILRNGKYFPCLPGGVGSCERPVSFWFKKFEKTFCHLFMQAGIQCSDRVPRGSFELRNYGLLLPFDIFPAPLRSSKSFLSKFVNARYTIRTVVRDRNNYQRVKGCYVAEFDVRVAAN